jgi:hypothetical protein
MKQWLILPLTTARFPSGARNRNIDPQLKEIGLILTALTLGERMLWLEVALSKTQWHRTN